MGHITDFNSAWIISNAGIFNRTDGHRIKLFEESVTFIAQLQNEDGSTLNPPMNRGDWIIGNWRIPNKHLPVIIGVSSGILILLFIITVLIAWRCCRYQKLKEKNLAMHSSLEEGRTPVFTPPPTNSTLPRGFPSMLVMPMSKPASPLMIHSKLTNRELISLTAETPTSKSKLGRLEESPQHQHQQVSLAPPQRHSCDDMSQVGMGCYIGFDLPDLPDLHNASPSAWTNGEHNGAKETSAGSCLSGDPELRTRSLPAWVRNKSVLQHSEHSGGHGYIKEMQHNSIAPKKNHALRHDTAALIALSKTKQDRVSLVNNEAVIVFDERTAL